MPDRRRPGPSRITCKAVLLPAPLGPVSTVTEPGVNFTVSPCGAVPSRPATDVFESDRRTGRSDRPRPRSRLARRRAGRTPSPPPSSVLCGVELPTRRSGQNTSGASSSAVSAWRVPPLRTPVGADADRDQCDAERREQLEQVPREGDPQGRHRRTAMRCRTSAIDGRARRRGRAHAASGCRVVQ